jgi:hypothetical protein
MKEQGKIQILAKYYSLQGRVHTAIDFVRHVIPLTYGQDLIHAGAGGKQRCQTEHSVRIEEKWRVSNAGERQICATYRWVLTEQSPGGDHAIPRRLND